MEAALQSVQQEKGLQEASLYNVPVETLKVKSDWKGGVGLLSWPSYSINPSGREKNCPLSHTNGYGLTKEAVICIYSWCMC